MNYEIKCTGTPARFFKADNEPYRQETINIIDGFAVKLLYLLLRIDGMKKREARPREKEMEQ